CAGDGCCVAVALLQCGMTPVLGFGYRDPPPPAEPDRRPTARSPGVVDSGRVDGVASIRRRIEHHHLHGGSGMDRWHGEPVRYPDPLVQVLDASFAKYRLNLAAVERLATGFRWSEGPVYFGDGRFLLWSDIPNNRVMKWEEETGVVSIFRKP